MEFTIKWATHELYGGIRDDRIKGRRVMEIEGKGLIMNERGTDVWQSGREKSRIWEARRGQRPVE